MTRSSTRITVTSLFWGFCILSLGCSNRAELNQQIEIRSFGLAYHEYFLVHRQGPPNIEAVVEFESRFPALAKKISSGEFIVVWNGKLTNDGNKNDECVLAYDRSTPESGGWVLRGGGFVEKMSADQFNKMPKLGTAN